jgi:hypothetical protein
MRDFYASSRPMPLDQADGLRRLFGGRRQHLLAVPANADLAFSGVVLDRLAAVLARHGRRVLVVDAAASAPAPSELSRLDLAAGIEPLAPRVDYLAARGLPLAFVDTRGSAAGFVDALARIAPQTEVMLLHAEPGDLARVLMHRAARPLLIAGDQPESLKRAYASAKLLAQRCGLMSYDLLLAAAPQSPRRQAIAQTLASCLDRFLGALLHGWATVDPAADPAAPTDAVLAQLLADQLALEEGANGSLRPPAGGSGGLYPPPGARGGLRPPAADAEGHTEFASISPASYGRAAAVSTPTRQAATGRS